jgi:hypothetical protein
MLIDTPPDCIASLPLGALQQRRSLCWPIVLQTRTHTLLLCKLDCTPPPFCACTRFEKKSNRLDLWIHNPIIEAFRGKNFKSKVFPWNSMEK